MSIQILASNFDSSHLTLVQDHLAHANLPTDEILIISHFFDARGLACPMPLLKAKVSLRAVAPNHSLYLMASDPHSQTDLVAYCQKNALSIHTWTSQTPDTIFHFIITKKA